MKTTRILAISMSLLLTGLVIEPARADFTLGEPTNLGQPVNSSRCDVFPEVSVDGRTLYFASDRPGRVGGIDLWVTTRASKNEPWALPKNLGLIVNSRDDECGPGISADELELFFTSNRPGGYGENDLWVTKRATLEDDWETPRNLGAPVNSRVSELRPCLSPDGLSLYFSSHKNRGSGHDDLYVTTRVTRDHPWGKPRNLGPLVNGPKIDSCPSLLNGGLALIFSCKSTEGQGNPCSLWLTRRSTTSGPWGTPVNIAPFMNIDNADHVDIAADGTSLLLTCLNRAGGCGQQDIWQVPIMPTVDLNADGIVDIGDMCIMAAHWGEDYSLCDIGPNPLGDGIVDAQDVMVLAEHFFEEVGLPFGLAAHWRLDEQDGDIAYDSAGDSSGLLLGDPLWRPADGKRNGALELDGIDDCVSTPFVLNPVSGPFSVFAWVNSVVPGQVIVSQADRTTLYFHVPGCTWLCTEPSEGKLMTGLEGPCRVRSPLMSQTVIADGQWHHIGLVWDGSYRFLYVDGLEVASDVAAVLSPGSADGGLNIGAGRTLEPGSFFSGLIDDVRIYDQALIPEQIRPLVQ